jgi:hypothetical protein
VLEEGRWKLRDDHIFNTLSGNYLGRGLRERIHATSKVAASFAYHAHAAQPDQ